MRLPFKRGSKNSANDVASRGAGDDGCSCGLSIIEAPSSVMDVADVVKWEQQIAESGTSLSELMYRAGCALAIVVLDSAVECVVAEPVEVVVFSGSGNNGGDGWVAAKALCESGAPIRLTVVSLVSAHNVAAMPARDAAMAAMEVLVGMNSAMDDAARVLVLPSADALDDVLATADVVVDAMLGTGFSGDNLRGPMASWVNAINSEKEKRPTLQVIAADCPSGLNAQTGKAAMPTVKADKTLTMLSQKTGLAAKEALPYVGSICVAPLMPIPPYEGAY